MKTPKVTIIMYHYVRDLKNSRYPDIKGLDLALFIEQVDYLRKNYNIVSMEAVIDALENQGELPPKAVLLTFDDAYAEHFTNVLPILYNRKLQGSFYVPAKAICENIVLDVNKIHFILASAPDTDDLIKKTFLEIGKFRKDFQLESDDFYFKKLAVANTYDPKEVIFFKRLLQKELPEELRNIITNNLFQTFVGMEESVFSRELYMNKEQLQCMILNGMHIGHHSYDHYWLNALSEEKQRIEIEKGCDFLKDLGVNMKNWTMCYPYGGYDESLLRILKEYNCKLGLTTKVSIADLAIDGRLELPRLDTNDIPKNSHSLPDKWFYEG